MGKFSCDIIFSQVQQVEIQLDELHVVFHEQYDEAYKANFHVISLNKTYISSTAKPRISKVHHDTSHSHIDWVFNMPVHRPHYHMKHTDKVFKKMPTIIPGKEADQTGDLEGHHNSPPYLVFNLSMDKIRYTSLQFKIWEDKIYKLEMQQHNAHLEQIHLNLQQSKDNSLAIDDSDD